MRGNGMDIEDLREICNYIESSHSFRKVQGKMVKYISPTINMRTGEIFHVKLRRSGEGKDFSITNENKNRNLKLRIIDWLDGGTW